MTPPAVDLSPVLRLALLAAVVALLPLSWVWLRQRGAHTRARLAALTALTLFLTFDLVVFGAFTRLTDSGLGCPDWPGCYGQASPLGAHAQIHAAVAEVPNGAVTWSKAWIEMIHRYLAMTVGVLILVLAVAAWRERERDRQRGTAGLAVSPWWPTLTLGWVVLQGLFGKYTVTLKLFPAVVTAHLLGGLTLLALLACQHAAFRQRALALPPALRRGAGGVLTLVAVQVALGGWVSTNYAVLACTGFPQCSGQWWPASDFAGGFRLLRELGVPAPDGAPALQSLVAIHMAHRMFAVVAATALALLAWRLWRRTEAALRRFGVLLAVLLLAQLGSGLSNVVLGWPIIAALGHSAGAAALVLALTLLLARSASGRAVAAGRPAMAAA
jgi:cytochrome c oxidase assembly protein subunit 15